MTFNKAFRTIPYNGNLNQSVEIKLATNSPSSHLNMFVAGSCAVTMLPGDAVKLRDMLLELYPVTPATPSKFKVGDKVTYKAIVGYGVPRLDGRKGTIKSALPGEWYEVAFTGGPFDSLIKTHGDYIVADPVAAPLKAGDRVRNRDGSEFSNGEKVATLDRPYHGGDRWWLKETKTHADASKLGLHVPTAYTVPMYTTGRFIVVALEGAHYAPGSKPKVHTTDIAAQAEAERLAKEVGGTFHVFRATFEASREKPVIPPVKTAKL